MGKLAVSEETSRDGRGVFESCMRTVKEGDYGPIICGSCGHMFLEKTASESEYGFGGHNKSPRRSCKHEQAYFVKCSVHFRSITWRPTENQ